MRARVLIFTKPQMPDNFLSVYMDGFLSIMELDQWVVQMWLEYGIVLLPANSNRMLSNVYMSFHDPDTAA